MAVVLLVCARGEAFRYREVVAVGTSDTVWGSQERPPKFVQVIFDGPAPKLSQRLSEAQIAKALVSKDRISVAPVDLGS